MFEFITTNLLWTQAPLVLLAIAAVGLIGLLFFRPVLYLAIVAFLFCFYFFRNPVRVCPEVLVDSKVIVSPADGTILEVLHSPEGSFHGYHHKVSIFLSVFNVHVNWTPIPGTIEKVTYVPGQFAMAFLPKSSELNEHNDVVIAHPDGQHVLVRQIAGTIARRICCWVKISDIVNAGQKFGMIKFSSRVDLFLPAHATLNVHVGQTVTGGQTVLGRLA
jgi:phosphatidylserine decarboxylase